jgi:hypothetical protein
MTMTYRELNLGTPARYRIRVKGTLDPSWSGRLGGMSITTTEQGNEAPVTTLTGRLLDQAALLGVLNTLYDYYHSPLLSVEFLDSA